MLKRKCFLKNPKKPNMFPYINLLHDILKDQGPFPLIRMPLMAHAVGLGEAGARWRICRATGLCINLSAKTKNGL